MALALLRAYDIGQCALSSWRAEAVLGQPKMAGSERLAFCFIANAYITAALNPSEIL
jgi:hypothetical protein